MAGHIQSAKSKDATIVETQGRVFVLGSLSKERGEADRTQFESCCQSIGRVLAEKRFLISVASAATFTVDLHVLAGADRYCAKPPQLPVEFIGPAELPPGEPPLVNNPEHFPNLQCRTRLLKGGWEAAHQKQLDEADGIILIGGNPEGAAIRVGELAIEQAKPLIPVPIFGGAGDVLWDRHHPALKEAGLSTQTLETMAVEFDAELIVKSLATIMCPESP